MARRVRRPNNEAVHERVWIRYLLANAEASDDFTRYMREMEVAYRAKVEQAVRASDIDEAKRMTGAIDLARAMRLRIESVDREAQAQAIYRNGS